MSGIPKVNHFIFTAFLTLLVAAVPGLDVSSAPPSVNGAGLRSRPAVSTTGKESKAETIAKCLKQLKSEDSAVRRRAVLILGKYTTSPKAIRHITKTLADPNPKVREAALVSLLETVQKVAKGLASRGIKEGQDAKDLIRKHRKTFSVLPERILGMLNDSNVHIRRITSSALPHVMILFRFVERIPFPGRGSFSKPVRKAIKSAFTDEDFSVRKNMLKYSRFFSDFLNAEILLELLSADRRDIRFAAIKTAHTILPGESFLSLAAEKVDDPWWKIRKYVASSLPFSDEGGAVKLLRKLARDKHPQVALEAMQELMTRDKTPDLDRLQALLTGDTAGGQFTHRIIRRLPGVGRAGRQLARDFLQSARPGYRRAAIKGFLFAPPKPDILRKIRKMTDDEAPEVRRMACRYLKRHGTFDTETVRKFARSQFAAVRQLAAHACDHLPAEPADRILSGLLLDENTEVRKVVLGVYAKRRLEDWESILQRSLRDPRAAIRKQALKLLLRNRDGETSEFLRQFAEKTEHDSLRKKILQGLKGHDTSIPALGD